MGLFLLLIFLLQGCSDSLGPEPFVPADITLDLVTADLTRPTALAVAPGESRLYVTEQFCCVRVVDNGEVLPEPFLDLSDRLAVGGERGMLGIAFHPDYQANGYVYVSFTSFDQHRIERYTVRPDGNSLDPASATVILSTTQPSTVHVGGSLSFGPEGMLWASKGDGGVYSEPDAPGNAQDRGTLHGTILRMDVDRGEPYAIPPDNPFVGSDGRDEIWHYGLRNPWRFSMDEPSGLLYIGDVGEGSFEEVDVVPLDEGGHNFGWDHMEGLHCFPDDSECDPTGLTLPVLEYPKTPGTCASVIGGHVYRGSAIPELAGHYVYTDLCAGWIRSFLFDEGEVLHEQEWALPSDVSFPTAIGEGPAGELYVLSLGSDQVGGAIHRIVPADAAN